MKNLKGLVMSVALAATSVAFAGQEIDGTQMSLKDSTVGVSVIHSFCIYKQLKG